MTQTYSIETVIAGVGWLSAKEKLAMREILGHGASIHLDKVSKQVHLCWRTEADTVDDAMDASREIRRHAVIATGVVTPRTTFISVREIDQ